MYHKNTRTEEIGFYSKKRLNRYNNVCIHEINKNNDSLSKQSFVHIVLLKIYINDYL